MVSSLHAWGGRRVRVFAVENTVPLHQRNHDRNTIVFNLEVACERVKRPPPGADKPSQLYINSNGAPQMRASPSSCLPPPPPPSVYSSDLQWIPEGDQLNRLSLKATPPKPALDTILLAKLRPGQVFTLSHPHQCVNCAQNATYLEDTRNIARCQRKRRDTRQVVSRWYVQLRPTTRHGAHGLDCLATASYRLLPRINILSPIPPEHQRKFQECFPPGVIGIRTNPSTGVDEAYVQDARKDTVSREVLRHEEFKDIVTLTRVRDYFLCTCLTFLYVVDSQLILIVPDC